MDGKFLGQMESFCPLYGMGWAGVANKATQVPNQNRGHLSTSRLLKMRSISASGASSSSSLCRRRASIWTPAGFLLTLQIPLLGHTCCGLPLGGGARHLFALRPPILGTPYRKDFSPVPRAEIFYSFIWHYSPPPNNWHLGRSWCPKVVAKGGPPRPPASMSTKKKRTTDSPKEPGRPAHPESHLHLGNEKDGGL